MRAHRGPWAYGIWWILVEILDRHGNGDKVSIEWAEFERLAMTKRGSDGGSDGGSVRGLVGGLHRAGLINCIASEGPLLVYEIKKFRERQAKLKSKIRSRLFQNYPKTLQEREEERERDITDTAQGMPAPTQESSSKPYELKTKEQRVVCAYKRSLGIAWDDREWDKANYKRWAPSAVKLLKAFGGNTNPTIDYVGVQAAILKEKNLTYNLATLARMAWDNPETGEHRNGNRIAKDEEKV